jgi:GNAT superfamily N-acetyltransferase
MIFRHPNQSDWETFSALACLENWRVPSIELQLLKGPWAHYARVFDDDKFYGLVTAVAYEESAWIGNLIVPHHQRGKGYGSHLFKSVLADLVEQEMTSIWLTASDQGRSLYERESFFEVDRIERWVLPASGAAIGFPLEDENYCERLLHADRLAWKGQTFRLSGHGMHMMPHFIHIRPC